MFWDEITHRQWQLSHKSRQHGEGLKHSATFKGTVSRAIRMNKLYRRKANVLIVIAGNFS